MASKREVSIIIRAIDKASRVMRSISNAATKDLKSIGNAAQNAARSIGLIGAALTLGLGLVVNTTASFEQAMANTQSVIGATEAELNKLTTAAREMGRVSIFTASQAANAMFSLAQAGFKTNDIMNSLAGTMLLAAAGSSDLTSTTETVVRTLSAFGLQANESARVANVFAAATSNSLANIERLSSGLSFSAGVAAEAGLSLEETTAILAKMLVVTGEGSRAGTALRMALVRLQKPTEAASEIFKRLEVSILGSSGSIRNLVDIIGDLEKAGVKGTEVMEIFGIRAGPAMLSLIRQGSGAIEELIRKITGTNKAAELAATRLDTFQGQVKLLRSASQELQIVFGNQLIPLLTDMTTRLTGLVTVTAVWAKENKDLAKAIGITTIALIALTAALTSLLIGVAGIAKATELFATLGRGMFAFGNTTIVLRARLALLATGITALSVAIIGVTFGAILLGLNRIATSAKRARGRVSELIDDMRLLGFSFKDISDGNKLAIESFNKLKTAEEAQIRIIGELNTLIKQIETTTERIPFGFIGRLFVGGRSEERLAKLKKDLIATEILLKQIREAQKQFAPLPDAGEVFGPPEPEIDIDKIKQLTDDQIKLFETLLVDRMRLTKNATDFAIAEAQREAMTQRVIAAGNSELLAGIAKVTQLKIAKIRKEAREEEQQAATEAIELILSEAQVREFTAQKQAKQIADAIGGTQGIILANKFLQQQLEQIAQDQKSIDDNVFINKAQLLDEIKIKTLEAQGRMKEATLERFAVEINALGLKGATELELAEFIIAGKAAIEKRFREEETNKLQQQINDLAQKRIAAEADLFSKLNSIRESAFDMEQNRIQQLGQSYAGFIRSAISVGRQFFSAQEEGWIRALAGTVRLVTRVIAGFLRQRSLEKLKQADQAKTAAQFHLQHAAKMAALAAEAGVLAAIALATGNIASATALGAAAISAGAEALKSTAIAAGFEIQATKLQTEAAGLAAAAVAVEVAGAAVAGGLDLAADKVRRAAREEEEFARIKERRLDTELRLKQQILELEGRTVEARRLGIQDEAAQLREMGIDENLIRRFERLSIQQAQSEGNGVVVETGGVAGGVLGGESVIAQPRIVIHQTNTFNAITDTEDQTALAEWARLLKPHFDDLEELETTA